MGLRQTLNEKPAIGIGAASAVVLLAIGSLFLSMHNPGPGAGTAYYTIDDGKTWFADRGDLLPPFAKAGKEAVKAHVYTCDGGKTQYAAYLSKFTDEYRRKIADLAAAGKPTGSEAPVFGMLVKKPGDTAWLPYTGAGGRLTAAKCPDGAFAQPVDVK